MLFIKEHAQYYTFWYKQDQQYKNIEEKARHLDGGKPIYSEHMMSKIPE